MKPLVLTTDDRDLLSILDEFGIKYIRNLGTVDDASQFAHYVRGGGLSAVGPDVVASYDGPPPLHGCVVLHCGLQELDWAGVLRLGAEKVWEIPAEIDWLTGRLNESHSDLLDR